MEKNIDAKIDDNINAKSEEKLFALETKMDAMEKTRSDATAIHCDGESMKERSRNVTIENKAVATRFKEENDENEVKAMTEETIRAVKMKDMEYTIDCPAIPITHAFIEFQSDRIRDRYVRAASRRQPQMNGRAMKNYQLWTSKKDSNGRE